MPVIEEQKGGGKRASPNGPATKPKGILDRLVTPTFDDTIKILIYGESGSGKTRLAGTFPKPILWAVCSASEDQDNPEELRSLSEATRRQVKAASLREPGELRDMILEAKSGRWKTFVIDHTSGLENLILRSVLGVDQLPTSRSWGVAEQRQWGMVAAQFKEVFNPCLGLKCNVVCIAQLGVREPKTGQDTTSVKASAGNIPSITKYLEPSFSYIVQTYHTQKEVQKEITVNVGGKPTKRIQTQKVPGERDYRIRTVTDDEDIFKIKFRVPEDVKMPQYISDPSYDKIMALVNGSGVDS